MAQDQPDWTQSAQLTGGTIKVTHVTVIDQVTTITGVTTAKVTNKATTVLATGSAIDFIGQSTPTGTVITNGVEVAVVTTKSYSALAITQKSGAVHPVCAQVHVSTNADRSPIYWAGALGSQVWTPHGPSRQGVIPCSNEIGERLVAEVFFDATPAGAVVSVFGITAPPNSLKMRGDGRNYPIGVFSATHSHVAGTLVPAPSSPLRILVKSITGTLVTTTHYFSNTVEATVNGNVSALASLEAGAGGGQIAVAPEGGILLDVGAGLTIEAFEIGSPAHVLGKWSVLYDLVV